MRGKMSRVAGTDNEWIFAAYLGKDGQGQYQRRRHRFKSLLTGRAAERDAEHAFREWLQLVERELVMVAPAQETLAEYLVWWLEHYIKPPIKEQRTYESYRDEIARHISPELGHIPLVAVGPGQLQKYVVEMMSRGNLKTGQGISRRTVEYHRAILSRAFNQAIELNKIEVNPATKMRLPPKKTLAADKALQVLTAERLAAFLAACEGEYYYTLIHTAAFTGMRLSELLGLTWECVNFSARTVTVQASAHMSKDLGPIHRPGVKSNSSARNIDPDTQALEVLQAHQAKQPPGTTLVFLNKAGHPYRDGNVQCRFRYLVREHKLPEGFTFHNLRHTHASLLIAAGWSMAEVSNRLGHADITTTMKSYVRAIPDESRNIGSAFGDLLRVQKEVLPQDLTQDT